MKMWVVFSLDKRLRHIGHLDLMRAMQRALRRSGLPVRYSQGYNPHILLSLAAPLSVGMAGEREVLEVPLSAPCTQETFLKALNLALPPEIRCKACLIKPDETAAPMAQLQAAQYAAEFLEEADKVLAAVPAFLEKEQWMAVKRTKKGEKEFDLRPLVYNLLIKEGRLHMTLALSESGTAKPEAVLEALAQLAETPVPRAIVTRTGLLGQNFSPLENA